MRAFQRRRDPRPLHEPSAAEDAYLTECDRDLDLHFAEVEAEEARDAHLAAWREGRVELKVGMHGAVCLRDSSGDCVCTGSEVVVFVQDPADRVDDGRDSYDSWWSEAPR